MGGVRLDDEQLKTAYIEDKQRSTLSETGSTCKDNLTSSSFYALCSGDIQTLGCSRKYGYNLLGSRLWSDGYQRHLSQQNPLV